MSDMSAPSPFSLSIGGQPPVSGSAFDMIAQLKQLPSGFNQRNRELSYRGYYVDPTSPAGNLELMANAASQQSNYYNDIFFLKTATLYEKASDLYEQSSKTSEYVNTLSLAAQYYLDHAYHGRGEESLFYTEKAAQLLTKSSAVSVSSQHWYNAYRDTNLLYSAVCRMCYAYHKMDPQKAESFVSLLQTLEDRALVYSRFRQGGLASDAHRIEEGEVGFSSRERIGTDNVSQCLAIIAQSPITKKTGVTHLDNQVDIQSLDHFFEQIGTDRLQIRLVGARFIGDVRSLRNIKAVMDFMHHVHGDVISADIYDGDDGPSTLVVDPQTFTLEEKIPAYPNRHEMASNAVLNFTKDGKPLITQFDFTQSANRAPIHLGSSMLQDFRAHYLGKREWEIERHLMIEDYADRPICVRWMKGLEALYWQEWAPLHQHLEEKLASGQVPQKDAQKAYQALNWQSFYVGDGAPTFNRAIHNWLENDLFRNGQLQPDALQGVKFDFNCYESAHNALSPSAVDHAQPGSVVSHLKKPSLG